MWRYITRAKTMGDNLIELNHDLYHPNHVCVKVRCTGCGQHMGFIIDKTTEKAYYLMIADKISDLGWEFSEIEMYCPTCRALERL